MEPGSASDFWLLVGFSTPLACLYGSSVFRQMEKCFHWAHWDCSTGGWAVRKSPVQILMSQEWLLGAEICISHSGEGVRPKWKHRKKGLLRLRMLHASFLSYFTIPCFWRISDYAAYFRSFNTTKISQETWASQGILAVLCCAMSHSQVLERVCWDASYPSFCWASVTVPFSMPWFLKVMSFSWIKMVVLWLEIT